MTTHHIRSAACILLGVLGFLWASAGRPQASSAPDVEALQHLALNWLDWVEAHQTPAYYALLNSTDPVVMAINADPDIQLMYMDDWGQPVYFSADNINAARTIGTDKIWTRYTAGPQGTFLNGEGIAFGDLGIWDVGGVFLSHDEFVVDNASRVRQMDQPAVYGYHATHVAGTMIAHGWDQNAKGMAGMAKLDAYDDYRDIAEMCAAASNNMLVSNHSYSSEVGWEFHWTGGETGCWIWQGDVTVSETEDYKFGAYLALTATLDSVAFHAPGLTICRSAGNHRGDDGPGSGEIHYYYVGNELTSSTAQRNADGDYDSLSPEACAKNILTIGSVSDLPSGWAPPGTSNVAINTFSSWGPTDDGRIKPDVLGNGWRVYSCWVDTTQDPHPTNTYHTESGTSMATPNVSGSVALLVSHFKRMRGYTPRASTLKAILVATADEAGDQAGPDYQGGFGLMNTWKAADVIANWNVPFMLGDDLRSHFVKEDSLAQGEEHRYYFWRSSAKKPLLVTIAWTDPPSTPAAHVVDPTALRLVNDLDVRVAHGNNIYYPYVLDPGDPAARATRGDNDRDNVEKIVVEDLEGIFCVIVDHEGTLSYAPQQYSLVVANITAGLSTEATFGPFIGASNAALAQDAFPAGTSLHWSSPCQNMVFWNAGVLRELGGKNTGTPGDSIWCDIAPVIDGADLLEMPKLHYRLQRNPLCDECRTSGLPDEGWVWGDSTYNTLGQVIPTRYHFDLPDTGFFYPGDVLHYYIEASDDVGGGATSRLPADTAGFSDFCPLSPYPALYTVRALPTMLSEEEGDQPRILFWDDAGDANQWDWAFRQLGFLPGVDYDIYRSNAPEAPDGTGLGGHASAGVLAGYDIIVYTSGRLSENTLSGGEPGQDSGDDLELLEGWLAQGDKTLFLAGDNLATDLSRSGGEAQDFLASRLSIIHADTAVYALLGDQRSPQVLADPLVANPVFQNATRWRAQAGVTDLRTFDAVVAAGSATRIAEFADPQGTGGAYPYAAATLHEYTEDMTTNTVIFLPYDLGSIGPVEAGGYPITPATTARAWVLSDVLAYAGATGSGPAIGVPSPRSFSISSFPNPFNPHVKIRYFMPRQGKLSIAIYDLRGRRVKTLLDEMVEGAGQVVWTADDERGARVASGVYFYEARALGRRWVRKITQVR
jgi:hypothetical protein